MSRAPDTRAELRKLAHTLDVQPAAVEFLAAVPAEDLYALRAQIGEAMFRSDRHYFARIATLSKTVPGAVAAKLTEAVLPPLLAARTSELLEPARAVDMVTRISDSYLADVSAVMDPARAPEVMAAIPPDRVARIGLELARREEWVVIGGFVSYISAQALRASVATFTGEQLLRIGFVLDDLDKLDTIAGLLTDQQVDQMLAAAPRFELWAELGDQLEHLSDDPAARLAGRYAVDPSLHPQYRAAASSGELDEAAFARLTGS